MIYWASDHQDRYLRQHLPDVMHHQNTLESHFFKLKFFAESQYILTFGWLTAAFNLQYKYTFLLIGLIYQ
ncbi:hypothetical protein ACOSQ2_001076 [Xanthoceras sorbifolium]